LIKEIQTRVVVDSNKVRKKILCSAQLSRADWPRFSIEPMPDAECVNLPSVVMLSDNRKTMLTLLEAKNLNNFFFLLLRLL